MASLLKKSFLYLIILFIFIFFTVNLVLGFTSPTFNPPTGGGAISVGPNVPANSLVVTSTAGFVGIGTTNPTSALTVAGEIKTTSGGVRFPDNTLQITAAGTATVPAGNVSAGTFGSNTGFGNYTFGTSTNPILFIDNTNARVGVGTTAPGYKLTVDSGDIALFDSTASDPNIYLGDDGQNYVGVRYNSAGNYGNIQSYTANAANKLILNPEGGNVGIGTTGPGYPLEVKRVTSGSVSKFSVVDSAWMILEQQNQRIWSLWASSGTFNVRDDSAGVIRLTVDNTGLVGIGNSSPTGLLHVSSSALYVSSTTGFVGIGTTAPTQLLELAKDNRARIDIKSSQNYSEVVLARTLGTLNSPLLVTNNTTIGNIEYDGWDGSKFITAASIRGIIDGVSGVDNIPGRLEFYTTPNNLAMTIKSTGNVGIGTSTPAYKLHIAGTVGISGLTQGIAALHDICINSVTFEIVQNTNNSCSSSSARFKHDIITSTAGLSEVLAMRSVSFIYNNDATNKQWLGFIAEEVNQVDPRLVAYGQDGLPFGVHYQEYTAVLTNAIKELYAKFMELSDIVLTILDRLTKHDKSIQEQQLQIKELKIENNSLKMRIEKLESR